MASSSKPPDPDPDRDPGQDDPAEEMYPVQLVRDRDKLKYIIREPAAGTRFLAYLCNTLLVLSAIKIEDDDLNGGYVSEAVLIRKLSPLVRDAYKGQNFGDSEHVTTIINSVLNDWVHCAKELDPTFKWPYSFKDDEHGFLVVSRAVGVEVYHGHALSPSNKSAELTIGSKGLAQLSKALLKRKKSATKSQTGLPNNYLIIEQLLNEHTDYSVKTLVGAMELECEKKCRNEAVSIFYWKKHFSTIKLITDLSCKDKDSFFDSHFRPCDENTVDTLKPLFHGDNDGESSNSPELNAQHAVTFHRNDIGKSRNSSELNVQEAGLVEVLIQYGRNFLSQDLTAIADSVEKNKRLVSELDWHKISSRMQTIAFDHLEVYRICVQRKEELKTSVDALRQVKDSILLLVAAFMQKAEICEQLELDIVLPLVDVIMSEYFQTAHGDMPYAFQMVLASIARKCKCIEQIFRPAFYHLEDKMEKAKHVYLFSLLTTILSSHFGLLIKLPLESVATNFCVVINEDNGLDDDSHNAILEFILIFENNIKAGSLAGPLLNKNMSIIFNTIVSMYSTARKDHSITSQEILRSIGCAIYKLVEAFLEKAEGFDDLETKFVIPLVEDALDGFMKTASEIIPSEFLSLSKMVINKCNEANKIVSTLFNSSDEEIFYVEHSDYCLALLEEACLHRSKVFTKFTDPELNCIIQFTRWAMMKQTELNITKTSASCLLEMLKAFEERGDQSAFYKEHMLGFVDDAVILLCRSPGSDIKTICFDILAHLFTVVDNVSEPLWDSNYFPTHYNGMFAREQAANIIQSRLHTPYSEATKFVDGLFEARGDFSGFREKANNLLSQLKRPHQISESVPASTSYEYPLSSSCPELLAATLEKNYGERFENFLKKYKQDGCHSPHYEGVVCAMYMTGQIKFIVDFEHIISHDVSLASDMLVAFSRFQHKMKVVVSKYVSDMKRKLDDAFSGSMPHLSSQSLCGEVAVFVVHMPESIESFSEFIKLPGNEVVMDQTIFQGPNSVVIQKKTDIGRLALCSYIQEICQKHADGDSWDGQLSLEDFKVFNKKVFKICRRSCGFCTHLSTSRDYEKFAMDFLKLYGNSAFIKVLINDMKTFIRVEEYNDAAAREFRFRMMTHFAGKSSVLRALIGFSCAGVKPPVSGLAKESKRQSCSVETLQSRERQSCNSGELGAFREEFACRK
ncbi:uncharacterized protein [Lolium perenne]|uniref:uncharacterized protein isoform X2 n=1 Tax=Lolium perenne TaxID=4522 RepID=UPI0021F67820|nr:uncharacterized protein LOC127306164 isoform X2 [Lolium perenne]